MRGPIVCGTDLGEGAAIAERAAAALAKVLASPLLLVHVLAEGVEPATVEDRRLELERRAHALRGAWPGLRVDVHVDRGDVADALVARGGRDATVVVASRGDRPRGRSSVGRHAERVAQTSSGPVVTIRDARPFEHWARGVEPLQVTVGVDPSRTSRAALAWAAGLSDAAATRTTVVHVASPGWEAIRLGIHDAPRDHLTPEAEAVVRRDLARWVGDASPTLGGAETSIVVGEERVEVLLASSAAASGLLVVGHHRRATVARMWLGSVSRGTLTVAETNVALVPAAEPELGAEPVRAPRQLLVPIDFSPASLRALAHAQALAPTGASVRLLHVVTPVGTPDGTDDEIRSRLERLVPAGAPGSATTTVEVLHARTVSGGIWHAAERIAADLICMPSRDRVRIFSPKGPGSTVRSVIARCPCPVLLTPPERDE